MVALNSRTSSSLCGLILAAKFLRIRAISSSVKPCPNNSVSDALAFVPKSITVPRRACPYLALADATEILDSSLPGLVLLAV